MPLVPHQAHELTDGHLSPTLVVAGAALVAVATVVGAWLARGRSGREGLWLAAAAGALLVIAGLHLLPDAWAGASEAGIPVGAIPVAAVASFALAGVVTRRGCPCEPEKAGGIGTAGALAVHRFLEGSALVLGSTFTVAAALAVHAFAEGLAVGALLVSQPRRRIAMLLAAMCVSPIAGAWAAHVQPLPAAAEPLLIALAAGVLAQAARVSLKAAAYHAPVGRFLSFRDGAAVLVAATATALAVAATG